MRAPNMHYAGSYVKNAKQSLTHIMHKPNIQVMNLLFRQIIEYYKCKFKKN